MSLNKVNYVDGQTIISAQNMNDIQDEVIRLDKYQITLNNKIIIQPDYEQNDETAIDYIKNRPFYNSTVYKPYPKYSFENTRYVTYTNITSSGYYQLLNGQYGTDISDLFAGSSASFIEGQEYLVDISGHQFICKAKVDDSSLPEPIIYLGNASLIDETVFENTKEVFCIAHITYDNSRTLLTFGNTSGYNFFVGGFNYTLAIAKVISESKTIDPVFLPEATATTKGVVLVDDILNKDSKNAISNSAVFTRLENKVDKVNGKGLSDVNFTKEYEDKVKSIQGLMNRVSALESYNPHNIDQLDEEVMVNCTPLTAINIASNPQGAYITNGDLIKEYNKIMSGQTSDKITFIDDDNNVMAYKLSDKIPSKNDFQKGFSFLVESFDNIFGGPTRRPIFGWTFSKAIMSTNLWETVFNQIIQEDEENGVIVIGLGEYGARILIVSHDYEGLTSGVYSIGSTEAFISGLEIYDFDLSNTTAPVSQEQLGDISSILDSIIGEEVWTFTLEDGSTVDKVVISSD